MRWFAAPDYWFARLAFQRGLAVTYLTGAWWHRSLIRDYVPPVTRRRAGSGNLTCDPYRAARLTPARWSYGGVAQSGRASGS